MGRPINFLEPLSGHNHPASFSKSFIEGQSLTKKRHLNIDMEWSVSLNTSPVQVSVLAHLSLSYEKTELLTAAKYEQAAPPLDMALLESSSTFPYFHISPFSEGNGL